MNLHILNSVGHSLLRQVVEESIRLTGNNITDLDSASGVIGMVEDPSWSKVLPEQRIIMLKDPAKVDTVPTDAVLFNCLTLTMIEQPTMTLKDWLATEEMSRWMRFHARD